jgi:hypothetical protein
MKAVINDATTAIKSIPSTKTDKDIEIVKFAQ